MNTGMLWFDNDPNTPLVGKIKKAADYYQKKYGRTPDMCMVNPIMLSEAQAPVDKIEVRPLRTVLPGHLWIGVEDKKRSQAE